MSFRVLYLYTTKDTVNVPAVTLKCNRVLKQLNVIVPKPVFTICRSSIQTGKLPDDGKKVCTRVTPIYTIVEIEIR